MKLRAPSSPGNPWPKVGGALATGAPAEPNPNLLLWSEEAQQAVWTKSNVTVTADIGDLDRPTADELAYAGAAAIITQLSATAATTGALVSTTANLTSAWQRFSVSGTFDGIVYVASVYLREPSGAGNALSLRISRSAGFLLVGLRDNLGGAPTVYADAWKLETPDLTAYVKREGT